MILLASWIAIFFLGVGQAFSSLGPNPIEIRVRIAEATPKVLVRGFDLRIFETQKGETQKWGLKLVSSADKTSEWEFRCQDGYIRAMRLHSPKNSAVLELHEPVSIQTPVGFLHFGEQPYRNELRIYSTGLLCEVVNPLSLEKYLDGLVNSEFSSKWNEESIAAQVVVARTYAYYQILESSKKKASHFDVDATVKDQVYNGSMKEDFHSSRVADKTKGMILTVGSDVKPEPIKAFYHSTCGGVTELPEHVWGAPYEGFKKQIPCSFCSSSPGASWELDLSLSEITSGILRGTQKEGALPGWPKNGLQALKNGKLMDLRFHPFEKLVGKQPNRIKEVIATWAWGKDLIETPIPAPRFREWMGTSRIKSTNFQAAFHHMSSGANLGATSSGAWHFYGRGYGHGVGMCQWGAKVMGEKGYKMPAILKYYYPDAILRKLW